MTRKLTMDDTWGMAKSALQACKEHNETTNKMATMNSELWKEIGLKQEKIKLLEETIQDKDFEIADLNSSHADQLWELDKLEKENAQMKEVCGGVAAYEKKIKQYIKKESVDN
jgi:hypothetical protein|tara:strand:+ start:1308 stop:1646 length:339 start_codon:yes stop_codon:yes gene_type:complete